ncbi:hypothetical protein ACF08M_29000 [Streptomyces sp. NPDC015032]|uniref:hypothetical protein n=1 Tax=Streptomyces sp. NPDC015032 TaxID=3364937 RepID=UPI00370155E3
MPGSRTAAAGGRNAGSLRRTATSWLSLLVLLVAGVGWIYLELNGGIDTFSADGISGDRPSGSSKGQNVLVIGSDSRSGVNSELGGGTATASSQDNTSTVIEYAPGLRDGAETAARLFDGARTTASDTAVIQVILGSSFARNQSVAPGAPAHSAGAPTVADGMRSADDDPCADLSYG